METSDPWERIARAVDEHSWLVPLALFVIGVAVYATLAADRVGPIVANDEYLYGNLAQSLAGGDGFTWRGGEAGIRTLYPFLIAPAWVLSDGAEAYDLAKAINAVVLSAAVWPVWLMARELVGPRLAGLPAALFLIGMWMESSARIMTEALAISAATLALAGTLLYLRRGRPTWLVVALAGAGVAALARSQLAILVAVMALALTADVLRRARPEWPEAFRAHKVGLAVTWAATGIVLLVLAFARDDAFASYASLADARPNLGQALAWTVDYAADVTFMVGVAPWIISLALIASRPAWRDERMGPFLAVLVPSLVVLTLFAGWFSAGVSLRPVERYVFYLGPLLLTGMIAGLPWVRWPSVLGATGLCTLFLLLTHSPSRFGGETQGLFGAANKLGFVDGSGSDFTTKLALVGAAVGAALATGVWLRERSARVQVGSSQLATAPATVILCASFAAIGMFLVSSYHWTVANGNARETATAFAGKAPDAVDGVVGGRKTLVGSNVPPFYVMWVEFFNKDIDRVIVEPTKELKQSTGYGLTCPLRVTADGTFARGSACGASNRTFVMAENPASTPTLRGQTFARGGLDPYGLLHVVTGEPRLIGSRADLCPPPTFACQPALIRTWNDAVSVLELRFVGGVEPFPVEVAGRVRTLPPQEVTLVRVPLRRGARETLIRMSWPDNRAGTPVLDTVNLKPVGGQPTALN